MFRTRILVGCCPIPMYFDNQGNTWVEARKQTHFEIKVENKGWKRVLAVVSVDGLNVIDAKHKDPWNSHGYILNGNSSIKIPGWKISQDKVREFIFTDKSTSYAAKVGSDPKNTGVIGVAIFSEKELIKWSYTSSWPKHDNTGVWPETRICGTSRGALPSGLNLGRNQVYNCSAGESRESSMSCQEPQQMELNFDNEVAVGSGNKAEYRTKKTDFERNELVCVLRIYYDTKENLVKKGIVRTTKFPEPFPMNGNYCPDV